MIAIAVAARYLLGIDIGLTPPFLMFYPAIVLISLIAGLWPAVAATFMSAVIVDLLFLDPSGRPNRVQDFVAMTVFCAFGIAISSLANLASLRKARLKELETQSELRERGRAEELQTILDTLPIPVLIAHDPECLNVSANRAGYEHFDAPPGSNLSLRLPENGDRMHFHRGGVRIERDQLPLTLAITTGVPVRMVPMTLVLADGNEKHQLSNAAPLLDQHGHVRGAVAAALDVTDRVRAEDALRASAEHFRLLVEQAPNGIFLADAEGKYVDVNSAGAEMLGYTRDEILRLSIPDVIAPEDIEQVPAAVQALHENEIVRSEWKFKRKDGSFFPGEVFGRRLPDGRLQGILCDITDRKRAEEVLRQSEERFRVALKDSPITVFNQDRELRYTWIYNPQLCWQGEILGKTDDDLFGPEKARPLRELKLKVIETATSVRQEVMIRQNGHGSSVDLTIEPLFDSEGRVAGITGACMDIARLRELADSLEIDKQKLIREKTYLEHEVDEEMGFTGIVGQSPVLHEVLKQARVVAPTDSTVLLLGETGTGKELVARSIHALSSRQDKNFIKLNCAAVPTGLLESELFGHEKGAFTGAVSQKVGRLELADKGTLLLDEVGELPLELQPKLLRVLQDREFERLGGVRTLHVDVRIIAATNRDLRADVAARKFREDLFYRLNVFPIEMPPLRQRRGDIEKLVHHFVAKYSGRTGQHIESIPQETMDLLKNWNWPGNVRELENMMERMVILTKGSVLAPAPVELYSPEASPDESLTEMEREHIVRVLRETNGVVAGANGAASRLGIKRTTLQSMLKRFNIQLHEFRRGTGTLGPERRLT
jgi:formate hydrogenlyase transcriptional activator